MINAPMNHAAAPFHPVVIVGAGISGLALAHRLERLGIAPTILDSAPRIAETWRRRHQQLQLNTHRALSCLPGAPLRSEQPFAARDEVIRYIEDYTEALHACVHTTVSVARVDRAGGGFWHLQTTMGDILARHVVIATGRERVPSIPCWAGSESFTGKLIHAADFGKAADYGGKRILIVGAGNSGVDVLNHLVRVNTSRLWLAVRNGTTLLPKRQWGVPISRLSGIMSHLPGRLLDVMLRATASLAFGNLARYGLPPGTKGAAKRLREEGVVSAIDDGFAAALKAGQVTVVPPVVAFEHKCVILSDQQRLHPDVVICATGYRPGLESVVGHLGVLDGRGVPVFQGPEVRDELHGLWFLGFRPRLYGTFNAARIDSQALAKRIARDLAGRVSIRCSHPPSVPRRQPS